jgi:hypothetical protein
LEEQLQVLCVNYNRIEQSLVDAKLLSATLDMENDKLTVDLKKRNDIIKRYAERVTKLETELVQAKLHEGEEHHKKKGILSFFSKSKSK